ncbi:MAG: Mov34/MPN/PAD-1 family protein [Candidatus Marinamargulisbacteria bacterium]
MQVVISTELQARMIDHARQELPNECCGYITGEGDVCKTFYPMVNVDASPVHFSFDPKEQFQVIKDARTRGEVPLVVYHSHPESPARLSNEDLRLLKDPTMIYVIISLEGTDPDLKGYRVIDGEISNVKIHSKEVANEC